MKKHITEACKAHTNLSVFECVVALLESGSVYGGVGSEKARARIISAAKKEQTRLLGIYDNAVSAAMQAAERMEEKSNETF